MRNFLLTLTFIGTNYCGWQVQKNGISVQEVLQDAMEKVFKQRPDIKGCSRTDSGVHALNYFVSFKLDSRISCVRIPNALNRYLPLDIAVLGCKEVDLDFHARYSAKAKEYVYKIYNGKTRNPFYEGLALFYPYNLDIDKINYACKHFLGVHNFKGFMSAHSKMEDTTREIFDLRITKEDDLATVTVMADGFLHNMVRIIVGTLLFVSSGKIEPEQIPDIIKSGERKRAGPTAPGYGLYLNRVIY